MLSSVEFKERKKILINQYVVSIVIFKVVATWGGTNSNKAFAYIIGTVCKHRMLVYIEKNLKNQ
jgi:hypothetical protein